MTAELIVNTGEDAEELRGVPDGFYGSLRAQSPLGCALVDQIAGKLWRLRRAPRLEAAILDAREAQLDEEARSTNFRTAYRTPQESEEAR